MSDERDIVERLMNDWISWGAPHNAEEAVNESAMAMRCREAAAEITRLRTALDASHAALSKMPTEPFRSVGEHVLPLADRIENAAVMWKNDRNELEAVSVFAELYVNTSRMLKIIIRTGEGENCEVESAPIMERIGELEAKVKSDPIAAAHIAAAKKGDER